MRAWASLAVVLSTSGCLFYNPAYGDETGASTSGATSQPSDASSTGTTAAQTTGTATDNGGSGSASDSATTGAVGSTGPATTGSTGSTGTTGCVEELVYPDGDGDGYGVEPAVMVCAGTPGYAAQAGDCDDASGGINPGAAEVCDPMKVDEDCDGLKNESSPMNASCDGCALDVLNGHSYWFCPNMIDWDSARALCQAFGAVDLVVMNDMAEDVWVYGKMPSQTTWVGCRDSDPNAQFNYVCVDGQPLGYTYWVGPNPDYDNGCISMPNGDNGGWRDRPCTDKYQYVCESI